MHRQLLTVRQFSERFPAFNQPCLRYLLLHRKEKGFDGAIIKFGRRVLIDVDQFFMCIDVANAEAAMRTRHGTRRGAAARNA